MADRLNSCLANLNATGIGARKKGVEECLRVLNYPDVIQYLNDETATTFFGVTWESVFKAAHICVKLEGECLHAALAGSKPVGSATVSSRTATLLSSASLVQHVVTAAKGSPTLKGKDIVLSITEVFEIPYLRDNVGTAYSDILTHQVFTERKYFKDINNELWNDLLSLHVELWKSPPRRMLKTSILQVLASIASIGSRQSFLALSLKNRLPFLESAFQEPRNNYHDTNFTVALLQMAIATCTELGAESRSALCHFGETILPPVIASYRVTDLPEKKNLVFELLLLLVEIHHPHVAEEDEDKEAGEGQDEGYACDWDVWRRQLRSMYNIVHTELSNGQSKTRKGSLQPLVLPSTFLHLAVCVCKQLFVSTGSMDLTELNASLGSSAPKRRRVSVGVNACVEALSGKLDCWAWLAVLSTLLDRHPQIVTATEFTTLLKHVADLQGACKDALVMDYLCKCCASLLKVERVLRHQGSNLEGDSIHALWQKVWETTLRTVGLNQSEAGSHHLLRALVDRGLSDNSTVLLQMFLSGSIKPSVHSLDTLETILLRCNLPGASQSPNSIWQVQPSSSRCVLMDWLFPTPDDFRMKPGVLWAKVLVDLTIKSRVAPLQPPMAKHTSSMQEDYLISSFKRGLFVAGVGRVTSPDSPGTHLLVDAEAEEKLLGNVERLCGALTELQVPTIGKTKAVMNLIQHSMFVLQVLSMLRTQQIEDSNFIQDSSVTRALRALLVRVVTMIQEQLTSPESCPSHLVQALSIWYLADLHKDVSTFLRSATPAPFLQAIYQSAQAKKTSVEVLSGRGKTVMTKMCEDVLQDFDQDQTCDFQISVLIIRRLASRERLDGSHIEQMLKIVQKMCQSRYNDADSVFIVLQLIQDMARHVLDPDLQVERTNLLYLVQKLIKYKNQKYYGPKVCIQFVKCLETFLKTEPLMCWTSEEDSACVCDEVIAQLSSPFHSVRMAAASCLPTIFSDQSEADRTEVFDKLVAIVMESFVVEGDMTALERTDESVNRTASALHAFASVVVVSRQCRKKALFAMLQLIQEKNVSTELVQKVLELIGENLKLPNGNILLEKNLDILLVCWLEKYQLEEFPWQLLDCRTQQEFYTSSSGVIVPTLLLAEDWPALELMVPKVNMTLPQLLKSCYAQVLACFLPCYAASTAKLSGVEERKLLLATRVHTRLEELLDKKLVDSLLTEHLCDIIAGVARLLHDQQHFQLLCGGRAALPQPGANTYSADAVLRTYVYLQENSECPERSLCEYLVSNLPDYIQRVLLTLRCDLHDAPTSEDRSLSLLRYTAFADLLSSAQLGPMAGFVVRDVTHTLVHLVKQVPEAARFLLRFCRACLAQAQLAGALETYINHIVGNLIPFANTQDDLGTATLELLRFLVVESRDQLLAAIRTLDPFPADKMFEEMQEVFVRTNDRESRNVLEEDIKHFLETGYSRLECTAEGLLHLRAKLSEKKQELRTLYAELNDMAGFSEDCATSLLHRLICKLVKLTAHADPTISLESARCLGELGPADLTTLVLEPEASFCKAANSLAAFTSLVVYLLVDYLVDEQVEVLRVTSAALYKVLATDVGAQAARGKELLTPFRCCVGLARVTLAVDEGQLDDPALWCPTDVSHEAWVTRLATTFIQTLRGGSFLNSLIPVCRIKVNFSERILPLLVELVLSHGSEKCSAAVSRCMRLFFAQQLPAAKSQNTGPLMGVCFNRASVQCMLNVVHYIRLQRSESHMTDRSGKGNLDLDFLHVALAAQFCSAYFTSIMYAELWCDSREFREAKGRDNDALQSFCMLDYIVSKDPDGGRTVQNLLREAYTRIGDSDAVYGCGSSHLLDPSTRVGHYEMLGQWQAVMLHCDVQQPASAGMLSALNRLGLHQLRHGYQQHLQSEDRDTSSTQYDCLWRLAKWNTPLDMADQTSHIHPREFEKERYLALRSLHSRDDDGLATAATRARRCVIASLAHASLESSKSLYPALAQLQAVQELEDFACALKDGRLGDLVVKWRLQDKLEVNEFDYIEPVLAQRTAMLGIVVDRSEQGSPVTGMLVEVHLAMASEARRHSAHHVAMRCLASVHRLPGLAPDVTARLQLEEASLTWESGDHIVAKFLLQSLLSRFSAQPPSKDVSLYSSALHSYGKWMAETKSENPIVVIERYFEKSLSLLQRGRADTCTSLARFADAQYKQCVDYLESGEMTRKRECMSKNKEIEEQLSKSKTPAASEADLKDDKRAIILRKKVNAMDEQEIEAAESSKEQFLLLAIKHYLQSLEQSDSERDNLQVLRLVSLWLENATNEHLNEMLDRDLGKIPSHKFLPLLPQLAPRMGSNKTDPFFSRINPLIDRCAREHPHHTLPVILALANSHRDKDFIKQESRTSKGAKNTEVQPRVVGAKEMLATLRKDAKIKSLVESMELLSEALIELANFAKEGTARPGQVCAMPKNAKIGKLKNLGHVLVPSITLPVKNNGQYTNIVGIQNIESQYFFVGGVNAPKKFTILGTDGVKRTQLLKGLDDMRLDAVMQQVFTLINSLLRNNKETQRRKLKIRTYKVVPLSQRSGILEWCENTDPLGAILLGVDQKLGLHKRYYPRDLATNTCKAKITEANSSRPEKRLAVYNEVVSKLHPVFRYFFLETFPTPGLWFERRLAYIHSVATSSMIGYILGLGDRHVQNILIDRITAEVIHIDFGIAFEQGKMLPIPETVPFRLTRDIEDGMGVSGVEGVFRRCCEKTMLVLRQNKETILTILEVLLYDPLYAWTISPKKAANIQSTNRRRELADSQDLSDSVNKIADRALLRSQLKLQGTEDGISVSVEGQVNRLIQEARDPGNLSKLFSGWQAYL